MQLKNKNKAVIAVAGAGKTWGICNNALKAAEGTNKKILIITYTNKGVESIEKEYKKQNLGVIDSNVVIKTWFQFLLHDLIKPYQSYIMQGYNIINTIDFSRAYGYINFSKKGTIRHYLTDNNNILSNTASEFVIDVNRISNGKPFKRLEEIYSNIFIDEIQDMAGFDIDILKLLFDSNIFVYCVGDHKQTTYRTHNSRKNKNKSGINIITYLKKLADDGIIDLEFNNFTRRFGKDMCEFANSIFGDMEEKINSKINYTEENMGIFLISKRDVKLYYDKYKPTILKYDAKTSTNGYGALNFGQCKGMTCDRVLIYPNTIYKSFLKDGASISSPSKYYVAATRAKYSLAFVVDEVYENEKFKLTEICIENQVIKVSKYINVV